MKERDRLMDLLASANLQCFGRADSWKEIMAEYLLANGVIIPPCKVGEWIWYVYRNEVNKAKVEETSYDASKHGYYSSSFTAYAYDFKNKRQVTYHPLNETQKNKSNINGVEGMNWGEEVYIFLTKEEAKTALSKLQSSKTDKLRKKEEIQ